METERRLSIFQGKHILANLPADPSGRHNRAPSGPGKLPVPGGWDALSITMQPCVCIPPASQEAWAQPQAQWSSQLIWGKWSGAGSIEWPLCEVLPPKTCPDGCSPPALVFQAHRVEASDRGGSGLGDLHESSIQTKPAWMTNRPDTGSLPPLPSPCVWCRARLSRWHHAPSACRTHRVDAPCPGHGVRGGAPGGGVRSLLFRPWGWRVSSGGHHRRGRRNAPFPAAPKPTAAASPHGAHLFARVQRAFGTLPATQNRIAPWQSRLRGILND